MATTTEPGRAQPQAQTANTTVQQHQQHIRISNITFTSSATDTTYQHGVAARSRHRRERHLSESTASTSEYSQGRTDDLGHALGRRPTPYPSRKICGVSITSTTTCSSCTNIETEASWFRGDDAALMRKQVHWRSRAKGKSFRSCAGRAPTPCPGETGGRGKERKGGIRRWCRKIKAKLCPLKR